MSSLLNDIWDGIFGSEKKKIARAKADTRTVILSLQRQCAELRRDIKKESTKIISKQNKLSYHFRNNEIKEMKMCAKALIPLMKKKEILQKQDNHLQTLIDDMDTNMTTRGFTESIKKFNKSAKENKIDIRELKKTLMTFDYVKEEMKQAAESIEDIMVDNVDEEEEATDEIIMDIVNKCMKNNSTLPKGLKLDNIPSNKLSEYIEDVNRLAEEEKV